MVRIVVNPKTLGKLITVDEWLAFLDEEPRATVEVLSRFVVDELGRPVEAGEARKLIGRLTLEEWAELRGRMKVAVEENAVPNESGSG